ncbi:MAG: mersacidin/lichenicidin family type 2 lantibiotic [Phycicoccus sp.]
MNVVRAWKDPEYRGQLSSPPPNPAGLVELSEDEMSGVSGGSTWGCAAAGVGLTVTVCSPTGTLCGSCQMGTRGCC